MPERTIAAAQTIAVDGDIDANVEEHCQLAEHARDEGAELVLFPELSLTGYVLEAGASLAFSSADPRLTSLKSVAAARGLTIVVGAPIRLATGLHIGAFILSPDGGIDIYTKRRLGAFGESARRDGIVPPPERSCFVPGDGEPGALLDRWDAALAICADVGDPDHPARAAARGASLYLASMFVIPSEAKEEHERLARYARTNGMAVLMANHGGATGGLRAAGGSAFWTERGELLAGCGADGRGLLIAREYSKGWEARALRC